MKRPKSGKSLRGEVDAVVVGAGFAGLYAVFKLTSQGLIVRGLERASGVGGVWHWNRYPGARCDIESLQYSYSFDERLQQDWSWSERFASQPEILRYLNHVTDRFDLRRHFTFGSEATDAVFIDQENKWEVRTDKGETIRARFLIMATGSFSVPVPFAPPGISSYEGRLLHTSSWPCERVDFEGKRVGVFGTASSGVQVIPEIAATANHVTVFQRTANYVIPAGDQFLDEAFEREWKRSYSEYRAKGRELGTLYDLGDRSALEVSDEERELEFRRRWKKGGINFTWSFNDLFFDQRANDTAAEFVRARIRSAVNDPKVAETLCPNDHPLGIKRICIRSGYYETFNRENVTLVDLKRSPLVRVEPAAIRTTEHVIPVDVIVCATGFDVLTGALMRMNIRGRGGVLLRDRWASGPKTYLGLMSVGFPNIFFVTGPGSPSVLTNMIVAIEQHVEWIAACIADLLRCGKSVIEPRSQCEAQWGDFVRDEAGKTLFRKATTSWQIGGNVPGKPRVFLALIGGIGRYRKLCDEEASKGYPSFDRADCVRAKQNTGE